TSKNRLNLFKRRVSPIKGIWNGYRWLPGGLPPARQSFERFSVRYDAVLDNVAFTFAAEALQRVPTGVHAIQDVGNRSRRRKSCANEVHVTMGISKIDDARMLAGIGTQTNGRGHREIRGKAGGSHPGDRPLVGAAAVGLKAAHGFA